MQPIKAIPATLSMLPDILLQASEMEHSLQG